MQKEIWKDVKGYPDYKVSNFGKVKSLNRTMIRSDGKVKNFKGKVLKNYYSNHSNYMYVNLYKDTKPKTFYVHALVAIAFLNYIPNNRKIVIDHIDHNAKNNYVDNLQIITNRENCSKDRFRNNYSSKYIGVCWYKALNKWASKIKYNKKLVHIGYFNSELSAAKAYQDALKKIENDL